MNHNDMAVFFDCWDTVIRFVMREEDWNTHSLHDHAVNADSINWNEVDDFARQFIHGYYDAMLRYEITAYQFMTLLIRKYHIELDCTVDECVHEILSFLSPTPVPGIEDFLNYLDHESIPYAILSNTIYTEEDSRKLIDQLIPGNHFRYFYGSGAVGVKKPNPLFFQVGVSLLYKDIKNCVYIGDAYIQDVCGSNEAGFGISVWLNHKHKDISRYSSYQPSTEIHMIETDSYEKLIELFKEGQI